VQRCKVCGKKFDSISALREHHRAVHPSAKFEPRAVKTTRNIAIAVTAIAIVAVGVLVGYLILNQSSIPASYSRLVGQTISPSLYSTITGVSDSTLSTIGKGQGVTSPQRVSGSNLTQGGKPEVLYIGAEYCPYCAAERWSLVVALSKFGTFTNLKYMLSAPSPEVYPNTPTFSFYGSTYSSQYITFVPVEQQDRDKNTLQTPTSQQQSLMQQYDSSASIPFVDFANQYVIVGSQYAPSTLAGNWTQIASQLNNPNSVISKSVDGAANTIITVICKVDGGQPANVCSQSYAGLSLSILVFQLNSNTMITVNQQQSPTEEAISTIAKLIF
jgi:thiol-disulfide isomerase/thioredoxin